MTRSWQARVLALTGLPWALSPPPRVEPPAIPWERRANRCEAGSGPLVGCRSSDPRPPWPCRYCPHR